MAMITKVKLKSWRSHLETELDFSEGTNALIGIMGSGKTSILDAVCFGLFGTFPALQSKKLRLDDLIMKKPKHQQAAEVVVSFDAGGTEWSVRRVISRVKPTSAELRKNGELVEGPQPSRVNELVEKILKTSYDLFTRAIYSEQNSMDMFLTIPKGHRMKKIDELLAIDKFGKARSSVVSLVNRFNSALNEKRNILSNLEADPSLVNLPSLKEERELLLKEKSRLEQQLSEFKRELVSVERSFAEMKERREQLIALQQEFTAATALLSSIESDIDALKKDLTVEEIAYAEYTDSQIRKELASVEANENLLKENMASEQKRLSDLRGMAASKSAKLDSIENEKIPELKKLMKEGKRIRSLLRTNGPKKIAAHIEKLRADLHRTEAVIQRAEVQIPEIEESISELSVVGSSCPICDQKLTEKKKQKILKEKKARISRLKAQARRAADSARKIEKKITQAEKDLAEARVLEAKLSTLSDLDSQLKFAQGALKVLGREITETEKEAKMVEKALHMLGSEMEGVRKRAEQVRLVVRKRDELSSKIRKSAELQQKITLLKDKKSAIRGFSQPELERLENNRALLMSRISSIETRLSSMAGILQQKRKEIEEIEKRLRLIEKHRLSLEKLKRTAEQLSVLESALLATQGQLRRNFIAAVNQALHNIWTDLYPYRDFYSCRLCIDSGDYVLQLQDSTGWVPADGVASGGERALACLALRIAFALVLSPQLRWLVLDEPTHNLDSRAVEDLAAVLRDRITEFVNQVFLITHSSEMEGAVSGYLYKLERDKEKDGFTRITRIAGPES